ncbi:hypothetical protein EBZ39_18655, partial [bacterium]|nr:hypothetical protein [bacterium]
WRSKRMNRRRSHWRKMRSSLGVAGSNKRAIGKKAAKSEMARHKSNSRVDSKMKNMAAQHTGDMAKIAKNVEKIEKKAVKNAGKKAGMKKGMRKHRRGRGLGMHRGGKGHKAGKAKAGNKDKKDAAKDAKPAAA